MSSGRWKITVKERLVDFHLGKMVVRPYNGGGMIIGLGHGCKEGLMVVVWVV
jgi:hypothetical protein